MEVDTKRLRLRPLALHDTDALGVLHRDPLSVRAMHRTDMAEPRVLLWDFGNTLVDERWAWAGPAGVPGWEAQYRAFGTSELAHRWNAGLASTEEVAESLASSLRCDPATVHAYLLASCQSISFFPAAWATARQHAHAQALVTVNPTLFRTEIVPAYDLGDVFDVIVISGEEHTTDKVRLCEIALGRLDPDLTPSASVLIDNVADNVQRWRQPAGHGYVFVDDETFAHDLALGAIPGLPPRHDDVPSQPVVLYDVADLRASAWEIVDGVGAGIHNLCPGVQIEHVGATALASGVTKGDVDIAVRVQAGAFAEVVSSLREHFAVAQPQNWTPTYASFSDDKWELQVGLQVCVIGSSDDFLVALSDVFRREELLRDEYDEIKRTVAAYGADRYWHAKDRFLRRLIQERHLRPMSGSNEPNPSPEEGN